MKAKTYTLLVVCLGFALTLTTQGFAQNSANNNLTKIRLGTDGNPSIQATRLTDASLLKLDGKLDEAIWALTPMATGFTQRNPNDGSPASEKTEARIIYTNSAIFIGFYAYDSSPDSIAATLFRRDGNDYSDWVYVNFDSYDDKRTAFTFGVNPRGVQRDILFYDDTSEDVLWNAVWEAQTQVTEDGWTAEIKIPLSQLRFSTDSDELAWGINFQRRIARKQETAFWSPTSQNESGIVSRFGRLSGIKDLKEPQRIEIRPYFSETLTQAPDQPGNPFFSSDEFTTRLGGDIKYGVTSDLTLTATINPDFGQVEADPATINLSAFEIFFREQRPFFLEGNDIFNFGSTKTFNNAGPPLTFYSRRIGRAPQGNFGRFNNARNTSLVNNGDDLQVDSPAQTTIITAGKLSGKTKNGWSIGILDAITASERGRFAINPAGGNQRGSFVVEPSTNYLVSRVKKDINQGNTFFGGFVSATNRQGINGTYFEDFLHESAYLSGLDFEHNFNDREWTVSGTFSASQVNGSENAILRTQQSSARFFNRVDSDRLSVDPTKTRLSGYATEVSIQKGGGKNTRFSLTYDDVSPGYEVNDLGFQNRADYRAVSAGFMYQQPSPKKLRFYELWSFQSFQWNYDGDNRGRFLNAGGFWQFQSLWSFNVNVNHNTRSFNDRLTRGGPVAQTPRSTNFNFNFNSDRTKKFSFNMGNFHRWEETAEFDHYYWAGVTYRPTTFIQVSFNPEIGFERDIDQYVRAIADPTANFGTRYVFSDLAQRSVSFPVRLNWTFRPTMSLQTFVRPFIATGEFFNFKEFNQPRTFNYDIYGQDAGTISEDANGLITVDPDGAGAAQPFQFNRPDFSFRSLQTNAVFRWEFTPGSTLFFVWQQQRNGSVREGNFNFGNDFSGIFDVEPTNVFLVKLSYWFGS